MALAHHRLIHLHPIPIRIRIPPISILILIIQTKPPRFLDLDLLNPIPTTLNVINTHDHRLVPHIQRVGDERFGIHRPLPLVDVRAGGPAPEFVINP